MLSFYRMERSDGEPLPLFADAVQAGFPSPADDSVEMSLDLNELLIQHPAATFFVRVQGESMQDAGIRNGDILIVDRALPPADGKIVIATVGGEFTVKRLRLKGNDLFLMPANPSFSPLKVDAQSDCQIWGVVSYVIHKT